MGANEKEKEQHHRRIRRNKEPVEEEGEGRRHWNEQRHRRIRSNKTPKEEEGGGRGLWKRTRKGQNEASEE
jgi:hypothetical protein